MSNNCATPWDSISRSMCSAGITSGSSRTAISSNLFKFQAPVRRVIFFERYTATLQLAFLALVVCAAFAIPLGMLAAAARRPTALSEGVLSE